MTAILYSEGLRDLGAEFEDPLDPDGSSQGPLRHLIRSVLKLKHPDGLMFETRRLGKVHGLRDRRESRRGLRGYARKVYRAIRDAERDDYDCVVVVVDRDGKAKAHRLDKLRQGRDKARSEDHDMPCALGVAQEMVESWLLGDANAWQRAFGQDALSPPEDPEKSTGARGSPNYAKDVMKRLLEQAEQPASWRSYGALVKYIDTDELERTCHRSFVPFADELRREIKPVYDPGYRNE